MKKTLPRFLYGFLSASSSPINLSVPWQPSDRDGLFQMNYDTTQAELTNLVCWAKTNKGERVMDFNFGLDAKRYLFEPESFLKDNLLNNARQQLKKYFPHLVVQDLKIFTNSEDKSLNENSARFYLEAKIKNTEIVISINEVLTQ